MSAICPHFSRVCLHNCGQSASFHIFCPQLSAVSTKLILAGSFTGSSANFISSKYCAHSMDWRCTIPLPIDCSLHGAGVSAVCIYWLHLSTFLQTDRIFSYCDCMCPHCVHKLNKWSKPKTSNHQIILYTYHLYVFVYKITI